MNWIYTCHTFLHSRLDRYYVLSLLFGRDLAFPQKKKKRRDLATGARGLKCLDKILLSFVLFQKSQAYNSTK